MIPPHCLYPAHLCLALRLYLSEFQSPYLARLVWAAEPWLLSNVPHCGQRRPRLGRGGQGQNEGSRGLPARGWGEGAQEGSPFPTSAASLCPATIFPSFTSSASLACLHSPNTNRLLSWVLSHPQHTASPSVPAPSQPQGQPRGAPCRPRLMGARWPPGDSASHWPVGTQASSLPMPPHPRRLLQYTHIHTHRRNWLQGQGQARGHKGGAWRPLTCVEMEWWHPALA